MIKMINRISTSVILFILLVIVAYIPSKAQAGPMETGVGQTNVFRAWVLVVNKESKLNLESLAKIENATVCSTPNAGAAILNKKISDLNGSIEIDTSKMFIKGVLENLKKEGSVNEETKIDESICIAAVIPHKYTNTKYFNQHFKISTILTGDVNSIDFVSFPARFPSLATYSKDDHTKTDVTDLIGG